MEWSPRHIQELKVHREQQGAFPSVAVALRSRRSHSLKLGLDVIVNSNMLYASDFWDFSTLEWLIPEDVLIFTSEARIARGCPTSQLLQAYAAVKAATPSQLSLLFLPRARVD